MESRPQTVQDVMAQIESSRESFRTVERNNDNSIQLQQQVRSLSMVLQSLKQIMDAIVKEANTLNYDKAPFLLAKCVTVFPTQQIIEQTSLLDVLSTLLEQFKAKMADESSDFDDSSDSDATDVFTKMLGVDFETLENTVKEGKKILEDVKAFHHKCLVAEIHVNAMKIQHASIQELLEAKDEKPQEEKSKKRTADEAKLSDSPSPLFKQARTSDHASIPTHNLRKR